MLQNQYEEVQQRIEAACRRCGRDRSEVTLVAVSKTKPVEMLEEVYGLAKEISGKTRCRS